MKIIEAQQGSPEWLAIRAKHHTASEAPAMMGASKYQTRNDLLHRKATGQEEEITPAKQALFDRGHEAEAKARELAEVVLGEQLFPVTATDDDGYLLASFDGLTMDDTTGWENKLWNEDLAAQVMAGELDPHYYWQLEQQILVGGLDRVLFSCSDGTKDRFVSMFYTPIPGRAEQLMAGWRQFDADLAAYVPPEVIPAAVAAPQAQLPAVSVQVFGSIEVRDNLAAFGDALTAYVERINKTPKTDDDFATLEATAKKLREAEEALDAAESSAIGQAGDIDTLRRTIGNYRELARQNRLVVEKLVKAEKENRKNAIIHGGREAIRAHIAALNDILGKPYMPTIECDFSSKAKGLKTIASIQNAVGTELARATIEADAAFNKIAANLRTLREEAADYKFLFADAAQIVIKAPDDMAALVKLRISDHKDAEAKRLEAERERIAAEERAKAEAAVAAPKVEQPAAAPTLDQVMQAAAPAPIAEAFAVTDDGRTIKLGEINAALSPLSITMDGLSRLGFQPCGNDRRAILYPASKFQAICDALIRHIQRAAAGTEPLKNAA